MLKNIKNLGKALNKAEQKGINGGRSGGCCNPANDCCTHLWHLHRCPGTGSPGCQFLYSTTGPNNPQYPYYNCCI